MLFRSGSIVAYYTANQKSVDEQIEAFGRLSQMGAMVDGKVSAARAFIAQSGAESPAFYHPVT